MRALVILLLVLLAFPVHAEELPPLGPDRFVRIDPIVLPTLRKGRPDRQVTLIIVLQVADARSRGLATDRMPKLRDAYITELMRLLDYDWPGGAILDLAFTKRRLLAQAENILGPKVVEQVLFDTVRERRV